MLKIVSLAEWLMGFLPCNTGTFESSKKAGFIKQTEPYFLRYYYSNTIFVSLDSRTASSIGFMSTKFKLHLVNNCIYEPVWIVFFV